MNLEDKVIVVTGGSGLIGKQIVDFIREMGALTINADVIKLEGNRSNIDFLEMDITNDNSIMDSIKTILEKYGRIDGWVNSAYPRTKDWGEKIENISFDSWRKNVDWHLNGYFVASKLAIEAMILNGKGSLVNISSIYGMVGPDFSIYNGTEMTMPVAYSAIKAGIINLDRYLASYYGNRGIRVNTVSPGGIFDNQPKSFLDAYNSKVPLGRLGKPEEVAPAVAFLLSDYSTYITGHNLAVDGGWTAI